MSLTVTILAVVLTQSSSAWKSNKLYFQQCLKQKHDICGEGSRCPTEIRLIAAVYTMTSPLNLPEEASEQAVAVVLADVWGTHESWPEEVWR